MDGLERILQGLDNVYCTLKLLPVHVDFYSEVVDCSPITQIRSGEQDGLRFSDMVTQHREARFVTAFVLTPKPFQNETYV